MAVMRPPGWVVALVMLAALATALFLMSFAVVIAGTPSWHFAGGMFVLEFFYFGWLLALGRSLCTLPGVPKRGRQLALVAFVATLGYCIIQGASGSFPRGGPFLPLFAVLHLGALLANLYLLYFASRNLISAERRRSARLPELLPTLVVAWFSCLIPLGAWWLHARARRASLRSTVA